MARQTSRPTDKPDADMDALTKTFEGHEIRVLPRGGDLCIVGADFAEALGYSKTASMLTLVLDEWKGAEIVETPGGAQEMTVIHEQGVYQVLGRTTKDAALPFQKWMYGEVLPEIRKTGRYARYAAQHDTLTSRANALRSEIDALRSEIQDKQNEIDARQAKLDEAKAALSEIVGGDALPPSDEPPQLSEPGLPTEMSSGESQADLTDPAVPDVIDAARHLVLERPLVLFDLETTGIKTEAARIVQVAMYRMVPGDDGAPAACPDAPALLTYLDPEEPIPKAASDVNGITTADVTGMPTFAAVAEDIADMVRDADLCAYNGASFDIPLLRAEFVRAGHLGLPGPPDRKIVDPYLLERRLMPRSLEAAHRRYTGKPLEGAHDADADIKGTWRVLEEQVKRIPDAGDAVTPADLDTFARGDYLDMGRKLKRDGGDVIVMFGKHEGSSLRWLRKNEPGYLQWMIGEISDLRPHIKDHLNDDEMD